MKFLILILSLLLSLNACSETKSKSVPAANTPAKKYTVEEAYTELELALNAKAKAIENYIQVLRKKAKSIRNDVKLQGFFDYFHQDIDYSDSIEMQLIIHHIKHYPEYHDILFFDSNGQLFKHILKEATPLKNLFLGTSNRDSLHQKIRRHPGKTFVDFDVLLHQEQKSSFFIHPVNTGWIALEVSKNKLDNYLNDYKNMGQTGEFLLVNHSHLLLNNSRFSPIDISLKKSLSQENMELKFAKKKGRAIVMDYRNQKVLSAFKTFRFLDTEWLLIAKIDYREVLRKIWQNTPISTSLFQKSVAQELIQSSDSVKCENLNNPQVHMDEFKRISADASISTHGVTTCTGILIHAPKRFSYLAHLSPSDRIYQQSGTDLLGWMLEKINNLELIPNQRDLVNFYIISPDTLGIKGAISKILDRGYFLDQIHISNYPEALFANIHFQGKQQKLNVCWGSKNNQVWVQEMDFTYPSLGDLLSNESSVETP